MSFLTKLALILLNFRKHLDNFNAKKTNESFFKRSN